ncbi:phosphoribosylaminoimidazolesuccinocarboxamide synthase [Clostridium subterminale]|uniref:Phosphoribosylaminoimidazole-succinocarboxamide synthase n=1 Tax=Clostridium subterminale TaxID=1550 RepID=A0ABN1KH74_CLOSU
MDMKNFIYEGKAKRIFKTEKEDEVLVYYKDDATAFNGEKKASIASKGILNNTISSIIFEMLKEKGIKTHFVEKISDREQICKRVDIIPLEIIVRNIAAGSMAKRYGVEEGTELKTTVLEISYKNDELGDPLMNDYHAMALEIATKEELDYIYDQASKVNKILTEFFLNQDIKLVDFKLEFGKLNGEILLADEVSPDTCRLWDLKTGEKLDKDRFRRELGDLVEGYTKVLERIK